MGATAASGMTGNSACGMTTATTSTMDLLSSSDGLTLDTSVGSLCGRMKKRKKKREFLLSRTRRRCSELPVHIKREMRDY